jgi:hypothetical protein
MKSTFPRTTVDQRNWNKTLHKPKQVNIPRHVIPAEDEWVLVTTEG